MGSVRGKAKPGEALEPRVTKSGHETFSLEEFPSNKEPGREFHPRDKIMLTHNGALVLSVEFEVRRCSRASGD